MVPLLCYMLLWSSLGRAQNGETNLPVPSDATKVYGTPASLDMSTAGPSATVAPNGTFTTVFAPQFTVPASADEGAVLIANIYDPNAVDAQTVCPGYKGTNVKRTRTGLVATLVLAGEPCNVYGNDVDTLNLTVEYQASDRLAVNIHPTYLDAKNQSFYILPDYSIPKPVGGGPDSNAAMDLAFFWSNEPTFSFTVVRKATGDVLFSTMGTKLVYEDQFIEFASALPNNFNLFGLGESIHSFRLGNNFTKTIYATDQGNAPDYNLYGGFPFYVDTRYYERDSSTGNLTLVTSNETDPKNDYISYSHGLYNRNAHGQEILLRPTNITWRALGGSIDLYFYAGPRATDVVASFQHSAAGLPAMQQYFTLGYHQCRWGYANWSQLEEVVDNFARFDLPLDNIWTDIDYMNQYRDFENDPYRYGYDEGRRFLQKLADNGQHYIPIVDSAIYVPNPDNATDAYPIFDRGNSSNAFLLNPDGSLYIGDVWPGYTVFPDWLPESGAADWWTKEVVGYHDKVNFSGIWIDMSEASSFCVGSCGSNNLSLNPAHTPFSLPGEPGNFVLDYPEGFNLTNETEAASASSASASQASSLAAAMPSTTGQLEYLRTTPTPGRRNVNHPPYVINNIQGDLAVHAVSPNATHHDGTLEYDVHNIWGHGILNATYNALLKVFPGKRPFIIGRSTFVGSAAYAGHWGGDNASKFVYMYWSIAQALSFSLAGQPFFGADTCGFNGNSDEELCNRWMKLSAFFPFYRNHNTLTAIPQEPYRWASVIESTKQAMRIRYGILPYMYTLLYRAHQSGQTVIRALAWEFPDDPSLAGADLQFFLGPALLVTPVLSQGATTVNGVFPGVGKGEVYYDYWNHSAVIAGPGQNVTLDAPLNGNMTVFHRGGYILAHQELTMTTRDTRKTPWNLWVAMSLEGTARGELYLDDGESVEPEDTLEVELAATKSSIWASGRGTYEDKNPLSYVTILGLQEAPGNVTFNGMPIPSENVFYDSDVKYANITGLRNLTSDGAWSQDWVLNLKGMP